MSLDSFVGSVVKVYSGDFRFSVLGTLISELECSRGKYSIFVYDSKTKNTGFVSFNANEVKRVDCVCGENQIILA